MMEAERVGESAFAFSAAIVGSPTSLGDALSAAMHDAIIIFALRRAAVPLNRCREVTPEGCGPSLPSIGLLRLSASTGRGQAKSVRLRGSQALSIEGRLRAIFLSRTLLSDSARSGHVGHFMNATKERNRADGLVGPRRVVLRILPRRFG